MKISKIEDNKKRYMSLLFLADEQEDMIDRYLEKGTMYVLEENGVKAECVVTDEGSKVLEIKNIAVLPECQRMGYGKRMIEFIEQTYRDNFRILRVGTGDSQLTLPFYKKCGFIESHRIKTFSRTIMIILSLNAAFSLLIRYIWKRTYYGNPIRFIERSKWNTWHFVNELQNTIQTYQNDMEVTRNERGTGADPV